MKSTPEELVLVEVSLLDASAYINQLNLDYIVESMCDPAYPLPRWTKTDARLCCEIYKKFLMLQKIYRTENLVPTREIDEFWHNHILFTQEYMKDCINIYGCYLHHAPVSPNENLQNLVDNFRKTKDLYFNEFKVPLQLINTNM
jgi:hypothetical protein